MATDRSPEEWDLAVRQQAALAAVGQLALQAADLDELLEGVLLRAAETLGVGEVVLFEALAEREAIGVRAACRDGYFAPQRYIEDLRLPLGSGSLPGFVVTGAAPLVTADLRQDPRFRAQAAQHDTRAGSAVGAPISWGQRPWGALIAFGDEGRHWNDDEIRFVTALASTVGLAIQRSQIEEALRTSSLRLDLSLVAGGFGPGPGTSTATR